MSNVSTPYYKLLDLALILLSTIFSYKLRFNDWTLSTEYLIPAFTLAVLSVFSLSAAGFYSATNSRISSSRISSVAIGTLIAAVLTASFLYLTKTGELYSRIWLVSAALLSALTLILSRVLLASVFSVSVGKKSVLLIGSNDTAVKVAAKLRKSKPKFDDIQLIEHIITNSDTSDLAEQLQNVLSHVSRFRSTAEEQNMEIWITSDVYSKVPATSIQLMLSDTAATIAFIPELPNFPESRALEIHSVIGIPIINSGLSKKRKINTALKYLEDKLFGSLMILVLSPLLAIIAIAIKLDSKGPVFFKQRRHGFGADEFQIYKFRTMTHEDSQAKFSQATKEDMRVTRVGKLLRRTSLDELPQLFNVLNGSMSLVGPRPHPVELNNDFQHKIDRFMARHSVKPGITGLAQIRGYRGETITFESMESRINSDLEYVQNWSVLLDLKILISTVAHVFLTDKAY